jgi:hypothetical protein
MYVCFVVVVVVYEVVFSLRKASGITNHIESSEVESSVTKMLQRQIVTFTWLELSHVGAQKHTRNAYMNLSVFVTP